QSHNWGTLVECVFARKLVHTPYHVHAERGTVMGMVDAGGLRYSLRAAAMRMALRPVDRVISSAHAVAHRVEQRSGFPASRIQIISNGVLGVAAENRAAIRREIRQQLGISEHAFLMGSVGRLSHVKGYDLALRAFADA